MSLPALRTTPTTPLLAAAIGRPIAQFTPTYGGAGRGQTGNAKVFTATVDWRFYGASPNVPVYLSINIASASAQAALECIRSVYIDNTFSSTPVYVYFPDTEFCVYCPSYSCVMSPVWTNTNTTAYIYANLFTTFEFPVTTVQFSDACHAGYSITPASGDGTTPATGLSIGRLLLVGAGGGGGNSTLDGSLQYGGAGGGGSGAALDSAIPFILASGTYPVVVGTGGGTNQNGGQSSFAGRIAGGGGAGGSFSAQPTIDRGGGGRGASLVDAGSTASQSGASGISGQTYFGGNGAPNAPGDRYACGGGGGSGSSAAGVNAGGTAGGAGGAGLVSNITGSNVTYGGGGGGGGGFYRSGSIINIPPGAGGGVGGAGGANISSGISATGRGGGGGGAGSISSTGGTGSNGIVIIRYAGPPAATGGTITADGGDTIHTFTTNGSFIIS